MKSEDEIRERVRDAQDVAAYDDPYHAAYVDALRWVLEKTDAERRT